MKKSISLILVFIALVGCRNSQNYQPSNLTLVTSEQQIDSARNHKLPDPNIFVTKNQKGETLSIEEAAEKNDIDWNYDAAMKDRALMFEGKPQIYGSQIIEDSENGGWKIYDLQDPDSVDKRRAEIGMESLSEYVSAWNINFDIEQKDQSE